VIGFWVPARNPSVGAPKADDSRTRLPGGPALRQADAGGKSHRRKILAANKELVEGAREKLTEERDTVRKELIDLGASPDGSMAVDLDEGFADAAQSTSERSKIVSMVEGLQERLKNVEAALTRIEKGSYGQCVRCGQEINPERLEAIPSASLCIDCAQRG
jgi:DnaK suppressor protein